MRWCMRPPVVQPLLQFAQSLLRVVSGAPRVEVQHNVVDDDRQFTRILEARYCVHFHLRIVPHKDLGEIHGHALMRRP